MEKKEIKYYIKKHKQLNCYVLFKYIHYKNGYGVKGIYFGTRQECEEEKERIRNENKINRLRSRYKEDKTIKK